MGPYDRDLPPIAQPLEPDPPEWYLRLSALELSIESRATDDASELILRADRFYNFIKDGTIRGEAKLKVVDPNAD